MSELLNYILTHEDAFRKYVLSRLVIAIGMHESLIRKWNLSKWLIHLNASTRNRLPSLYSDFTLQRTTNPDGYAINVMAWEQALVNAAKNGYVSRDARANDSGSAGKSAAGGRAKSNHLVLNASGSLLRDLEIPELGQPVALSTVFVCSPSPLLLAS